jgi:hypothetical protein
MIDPLTALGLAANVLQFVDFASKLIGGLVVIYKSASAASEDNIVLDIVVRDIQRLSGSIVALEDFSGTLKELTDESSRISQELLAVLDKLCIKGQKTKWKCFAVAVGGMWKRDKVESMATQLGRMQSQVTVHLQASIRYGEQ